jgi:hypothetical protein
VIDANYPQPKLFYCRIANMSGHFLSRPNARLISARPNATGPSVTLCDTRLFWHAGKSPAFHDALKSSPSAEKSFLNVIVKRVSWSKSISLLRITIKYTNEY